MAQENKNSKKDKLGGLYVLLFIVILIWITSIFFIPICYPELKDRAQFGDSFGTINSLFSGLAFAGIIYTILLQRKELALQRQELRDTRKELKRSAEAQEKSEFQQKRQAENLKITAKLNALNTLINYHTVQENFYIATPPIYTMHQNEKQKYVDQIKEILDKKNTGN